MLLDVYVILAIAFPEASYCASFGLPLCVHPSRCLSAGILRDDFLNAFFEVLYVCILRRVLMCASVEVPCYVHPSRCCVLCILRGALRVCILRGVLMCASVEVPCYVHPSRCCVLCIVRGALFWDVRGVLRKTSPPFLVHSSRKFVT